MTESGDTRTRTRGRPVLAVIAVGWVALGFWAVEDGETWRGAAGVALGLAVLSTWLWPDSPSTRFLEKPLLRSKRTADR